MDDDTIILIVGDGEHNLHIKEEVLDEDFLDEESLDDELLLDVEIKIEGSAEEDFINDEFSEKARHSSQGNRTFKRNTEKKIKNELVEESYISIDDLQEKYPEFAEDEEALVYYLSEMMRNNQAPTPPPSAYICDDQVYHCSYCKTKTLSDKQARRHYQEKHGTKYARCYSCGIEYRCIGSLYRHEWSCKHDQRRLLLRARSLVLGEKLRKPVDSDTQDEAAEDEIVPKKNVKKKKKIQIKDSYLSVAELKKKFPQLEKDKEALEDCVMTMMKKLKTPPVPAGAYHLDEDDMYPCAYCPERQTTEHNAKKHYQEKHGTRYCICFGCGVSYKSMGILYKHEKRCASSSRSLILRARNRALGGRARIDRVNLPPRRVPRQRDATCKLYECSYCPANFITAAGLRSHEALHTGTREHVCHECGAKYTSRSALIRHTEQHAGHVFECDVCGRQFKRKSGIVSHLPVHNEVKPYVCSFEGCGRSFVTRVTRDTHYDKIHLRLPPPCVCQICPKRFMRNARLKYHMRRAHGLELMTRHMFFKTLPHLTEEEVLKAKVVAKVT